MGFADGYLLKSHFVPVISDPPENNLRCIVVIPAYREPLLEKTLFSLLNQNSFSGSGEVIIHVNYPQHEPDVSKLEVRKQVSQLKDFCKEHSNPQLQFHCVFSPDMPSKDAGVGLARKIGMDEAASRFNRLNRPEGIIVCCDADVICDPDYLNQLIEHFHKHETTPGCSIYFEHDLEGENISGEIKRAIIQYELYMRYYNQALRFAQFPYAFHTVGSSFAVRAEVYCKQGGMNRRKAGEDFYFLHKIIPLGGFTELNSTRLILSPRPSDRVPFGTGAAVYKMINQVEIGWLAPHPDFFSHLRTLIDLARNHFYPLNEKDTEIFLSQLPDSFQNYLQKENFLMELAEMCANAAINQSFRKRFFTWFDAFRILRMLNQLHESYYQRIPVEEAAMQLLEMDGKKYHGDGGALGLLLYFRQLERNSNFATRI